MTRSVVIVTFILALAGCQSPATVPAAPADASAAARVAIEAHNANLQEWYASGDIASVSRVFATDARQMGPNAAPLVGRTAIEAFWTENAKRGSWQLTLATQDVAASGDLAVERGTYSLSFTPGPGAPAGMGAFSDRGNYLVQWRRENDQWVIVNDLATSEVPLSSPAH